MTITNDKGRLSEEEIERMLAGAEEYAEQDKAVCIRQQCFAQLSLFASLDCNASWSATNGACAPGCLCSLAACIAHYNLQSHAAADSSP